MSDNKSNLPKLADLHQAPDIAYKNDQFRLLLSQQPPATWLKPHPTVPNYKDLPIDKVETLLDRIFQEWRVEVKDVQVVFQSIAVTIRLHYKSPVTGEWLFHDGVGAKSVQTDKGYSAADLAHIKDAAVQMALPTAKSLAIKDAADHIGDLFGRNTNRKDASSFVGAYSEQPTPPPPPPPPPTQNYQTQQQDEFPL